jgi:lysophospholipase L1-like esterase
LQVGRNLLARGTKTENEYLGVAFAVLWRVAGMKDWQTCENADPINIPSFRIAGFGACMIGGYPHDGGGLFEVACGLVEKGLLLPVQSSIFTLGGFPAPRAEKYLKPRIFDFKPKYIVIQFGSTDAACPIRAKHRSKRPRLGVSQDRTLVRAPTMFTIVRWYIHSLVGRIWKPQPITSLSSYVAAIEHMVGDCISADITPVVLSPFILGSRYSTRNAVNYTNALHHTFSNMNQVIFIDCLQLLANFPRSKVLLSDGVHLSRLGHDLIGQAVGQAIIADIKAKTDLSCRLHSTVL